MTIATTTSKLLYNGDGVTASFPVTFVFWNSSDLRVIHRDAAGTETPWTEGTQYTVAGGGGGTGTVNVETGPTDYTPASGESLLIKDNQPETQGAALPLGGAFPSTVVEQAIDKAVRMIQIHSEQIARSILLPETTALSGLRIPEPGAGELLRYNAAGDSLETVAAGNLADGIDTLLSGEADNDFLVYESAGAVWKNLTPANARTAMDVLKDVFTTRGDLLRAGASGTEERFAIGTANAFLRSDGTDPGWAKIGADGRDLTSGVLRGYIDGLICSLDTDTDHDVNVTAGVARNSTDTVTMYRSSEITKQIDATWAAGDDAGGLADGVTLSANQRLYVHLLSSADGSTVDVGFDTSATAANLLADTAVVAAGLTLYRRIMVVGTDGSSNIIPFEHLQEDLILKPSTGAVLSVDLRGFPPDTRMIEIAFKEVSLNSTQSILVQIGDSGGFETSGYNSQSAQMSNAGTSNQNSSTGLVWVSPDGTTVISGIMTLILMDSTNNQWMEAHSGMNGSATVVTGGGQKSLSAALDRLRITNSAGTGNFDAGQFYLRVRGDLRSRDA